MKKNIILLFTLTLLTGCSAVYNLEIKNSKFTEKITSYYININTFENELNNPRFAFSSSKLSVDYDENDNFPRYIQKDISSNNNYSLQNSYEFDLSNYSDSNAVKSCYEYFRIMTNENNITLSTSNSFNCFELSDELQKVTINITSYYDVVRSNADRVNGKTYTWEITRDNASNKPILFEYDESKRNMTLIDYLTDNAYLAVIFGVILFVALPVTLVIVGKNKKVNKI